MSPPKLFPLFLKLANRACLVVGAGAVAEAKISSLLEANAKVRVIAPLATPRVQAWANAAVVEWHQRAFEPNDLEGMFLVVAATSSTQVHEQIFKEASQRSVLCNIVDVPELCDFYYPSIVQRGPLQIAISTAGQSPALAQRLRKQLEDQFGPEYEEWLVQLGETRGKLHSVEMDPEERKRLLHMEATEEAFEIFRRNRLKNKSK
jgi:precorrin-2 dehydrogenase / sirohydrochlorin ferrochelatase